LLTYPPGQDGNDFIVNSGLALRTINPLTKVDINVLPSAAPADRPAAAGLNAAPLIALGVCAALVLGTWVMSGMAEKQTADMQLLLSQKAAQLGSMQKQYRDVIDLTTKASDADQQMLARLNAPIKYLTEQRDMVNRDLGQVFAALPATVYLTSVTDDGNLIQVQGSAPSEGIMLNYARDLRSSGMFRLVLISSVGASTYTEVSFTIQLTMNQ